MGVGEDTRDMDEQAFWKRVGEVAPWAATARALVREAGALRVTLVLDRGEDALPVLLDCVGEDPVELAEGERALTLPEELVAGAEPLELPEVRRPDSLAVDLDRAEVVAPMGAVAGLAVAVRTVGEALPGRGVATAQWATGDPEVPFTIAARAGEPVVLGIGEELFTMGEGWPGNA